MHKFIQHRDFSNPFLSGKRLSGRFRLIWAFSGVGKVIFELRMLWTLRWSLFCSPEGKVFHIFSPSSASSRLSVLVAGQPSAAARAGAERADGAASGSAKADAEAPCGPTSRLDAATGLEASIFATF
jgi:hypothetical protein